MNEGFEIGKLGFSHKNDENTKITQKSSIEP